jgi:CheY-like chemotaxis protein
MTGEARGQGASTLAGRRILVVEDEFLIALDIEDTLRNLGCEVMGPAATVTEALALVETAVPDAAVLDVRLGDHSTGDIARELRQRGVPFMVLTGYDRGQIADTALREAPLLPKPLLQSTFRQALRQLLDR